MSLLTGILASTLIGGNTVVACIPLFLTSIVYLPVKVLRMHGTAEAISRRMDLVIDYWVGCNLALLRLLRITEVNLIWENGESLSRDRWYVAVSNHQSWTDIIILQTMLHDRMPPLKFFTKQQLIWIPFLGVAMWLLGFPYVRRLSKEQIASNPDLLQIDRQATLDACEVFRHQPTTILNFLEGTRFTHDKHRSQASRFNALLNPKIGGLALVLEGLEDHVETLVDVTIEYPDGTPSFWEFLQGRCKTIDMRVICRDIPDTIRQAAGVDAKREALEPWIEEIWTEKDVRVRHRKMQTTAKSAAGSAVKDR